MLTTVARLSDNTKLYGSDAKTAAQIDQWVQFTDDELTNHAIGLFILYKGYMPYNKTADTHHTEAIHRSLAYLEKHLAGQTFVVGHRLTAADLTLASTLFTLFTGFLGASSRAKYPHTQRYYTNVVNQRAVGGAIPLDAEFAAEDAKFVPPKKEKPAKAEQPKAAAAPAAAAAAGNNEDDEPKAAPPAKNPLDALPKSSFVMNDWKVCYSNKDTRSEAIPWFHEHFDKEGWSVWRFDFKYNDELTQVFMSTNQIGGFFTRLEATRKYVMGTGGVFGTANDSVIAGVVVLRGQEWEPVLGVAPDIDSYSVSRLDLDKPEDKKFFEDMLAWEATVDGKEWADGKILK